MLKFDKNLSIIHSYLCADGYVIKNPETQKSKYYYIGFRNMNETLLEDFENNFYQFFKVNPRRCKDGRTVVQNRALYYLLTQDFSYYSREWELPELGKDNLRYWLRAFFDCEGWVLVIKAKNRHIGLDSVNHEGLRNIKLALERLGIKSKIAHHRNRTTMRLNVFGKENLIKFQKEMGFLHPAKKKKLQEAIDSYIDYEWHFPEDEAKLQLFVIAFIKKRSKIDKKFRIRICSNLEENLVILSKHLKNMFGVESKLYGPNYNGIGTKFYELVVHKTEEVDKCKELFNL
jgi:hypothetical protein|tara:strand:+ start:973 stop:1836 length:864 start_codon:yes stop_codon:yes gene_type:complete